MLANASSFSATAVVPALHRQWGLTSAGAAWLVIVVQVGSSRAASARRLGGGDGLGPPGRRVSGARTQAAVESLRTLLAPPDGPAAIEHRSVPATAAAAIGRRTRNFS